jgi:hypothetical protein
MDEPSELSWSKQQSEKSKIFKAELRRIEEQHSKYFEKRSGSSVDMPHDNLAEHYIFQENKNGDANFFFPEYSDLDEEIKKECYAAFDRIYETSQK